MNNYPLYINLGNDLYMMVGKPSIATWGNGDRPRKAKAGTIGFNYQTESIEYWDGESWYAAVMEEA